MSAAVLVAVLVAGGVYLLMQRGLVRVTFGFILLGHAANVLLLSAGGMSRREPPLLSTTDPAVAADPLPQAFALTAIVITFGITVYLLAMAGNGGDDDALATDADTTDDSRTGTVTDAEPSPGGPTERGARA